MKKALICLAVLSLVFFNCSKKNITNNYYSSPDKGAIVGFVHPPDSEAKVSAHMGLEIASTYVDPAGYFELTELPIGTYTILAQAEGYFDYQSKPDILVAGGVTVPLDTIFLVSIHDLVLSVSPSDGTENVTVDSRITIRFRKEMNTESVESAFQIEPKVEGDLFWYNYGRMGIPGSTDLQFVPRNGLKTNTWYEVTIDTTASDVEGTKLLKSYQFSFKTEPIRITYTRPANKEVWVSPYTRISIYFNTDMDIESVISAFEMVDSQLDEVAGEFAWRNLRWMEFYPYSTLAGNEEYTVTIDTVATEVGGEKLPEPYQFYFTTEPIRILSTKPENKETWVDPNTVIRILFNTDMDAESVISAFKMVDSDSKDVEGEFTWLSQRQMDFTPDSALAAYETYTVTIDTSAKDISGSSLDKPYSFWFRTRP